MTQVFGEVLRRTHIRTELSLHGFAGTGMREPSDSQDGTSLGVVPWWVGVRRVARDAVARDAVARDAVARGWVARGWAWRAAGLGARLGLAARGV